MSLAVGVPVAISAIKALLKYRGRVDQILALKEAAADVPLLLPPIPLDFGAQETEFFAFFDSEPGVLVLELNGRVADYAKVKADSMSPATFKLRQSLLKLFFEATGSLPDDDELPPSRRVGASAEMRISYSVVASHRLSRNPALTRLILASADTLLEVAGENSGLFISNPKTQAIVASLINEFAGKRDFDDDGSELILTSLLRSAVVAAMENQDAITDEPAVLALFGALSDLRKEQKDEFVANILTKKGFQTLVGKYLTKVAADPSFLIEDGPFRVILADTLKDLGQNFVAIFDDPKALFGVLEVALTSAAGQAKEVLGKKINGKPLLAAVLGSVLTEIEKRGKQDNLIKSFANGEIVTGVFQAGLGAIAANPGALAKAAKIDELAAALVSGLADVLSKKELTDVVSTQTLRDIVSRSFLVLAENSPKWAGKSEFATKLVAGVLKAAASAVEDGLTTDDIAELVDAAIRTATANLGLVKVDVHLAGVLEAVGGQLSEKGIRALLDPESRAEVIYGSLEAVARNPKVWSGFAEADLVQPLVAAVFTGLATDSSDLLTGPHMVEGVRGVLIAAALRGQKLIDKKVTADDMKKLLTLGLRKVKQEVGNGIDGENLPEYLERLAEFFLAEPIPLDTIGKADFKKLHEKAMGREAA